MERDDLGMLFGRITRRLAEAERPVLERHGLTMWGYVALSELAKGAADTQLSLARTMGYDKNRLIGVLDRLEEDGLVVRRPDAEDRRRRVVALTDEGERRWRAARRDVRAMERQFLAALDTGGEEALIAMLGRLLPER